MAREDQAKALVQATLDPLRQLDVLINTPHHQGLPHHALDAVTDEDCSVLASTCWGLVRVARRVPALKAQRGSILNISSWPEYDPRQLDSYAGRSRSIT